MDEAGNPFNAADVAVKTVMGTKTGLLPVFIKIGNDRIIAHVNDAFTILRACRQRSFCAGERDHVACGVKQGDETGFAQLHGLSDLGQRTARKPQAEHVADAVFILIAQGPH